MWSSKPLLRHAFIALGLLGATALAGCTGLTPVYGERGIGAERMALQLRRSPTAGSSRSSTRNWRCASAAPPIRRAHWSRITTSTSRKLTRSGDPAPAEQREAAVDRQIELIAADGSIVLLHHPLRRARSTPPTARPSPPPRPSSEAIERAARAWPRPCASPSSGRSPSRPPDGRAEGARSQPLRRPPRPRSWHHPRLRPRCRPRPRDRPAPRAALCRQRCRQHEPRRARRRRARCRPVAASPSRPRRTSLFGDRRVIRVRGAGKSLVMPLTELRDDPGAIIILEAGNLARGSAARPGGGCKARPGLALLPRQ